MSWWERSALCNNQCIVQIPTWEKLQQCVFKVTTSNFWHGCFFSLYFSHEPPYTRGGREAGVLVENTG